MDEFEFKVVAALRELLPERLYAEPFRGRKATELFRRNKVFAATLREQGGTAAEVADAIMDRPLSQYEW